MWIGPIALAVGALIAVGIMFAIQDNPRKRRARRKRGRTCIECIGVDTSRSTHGATTNATGTARETTRQRFPRPSPHSYGSELLSA